MNNNRNHQTQHSDLLFNEIDFKRIFFIMWYYKWIILGATLASLLLGLFYTINQVPKYTSSTLIQVDSQLGSANSMQQMLGNMNLLGAASQASPADIEIALIKSPFILQAVIEQLGLNIGAYPHYFPFIGKFLVSKDDEIVAKPFWGLNQFAWGGESIHVEKFDVSHDYISTDFKLRANGNNKFSLYTEDDELILEGEVGKLTHTAKNIYPQVRILVTEIKSNVGTYFDIIKKNNEDVVKHLAQNLTIADLGNKDKAKTGVLQISFQHKNPNFIPRILNTIVAQAIQKNIEKKSAEASKTLDFLNKQLPDVRKSLEYAETNLNEYRAKNGTIDISQEAKIMLTKLAALQQNVAEVKLKQVELLQELTAEHPFLISLNHKKSQLQKEISEIENRIKRVPKTDQKAISLERDVKVKDQLYLLLLNKIQQLQVLKAGTLSDIRILNYASVPIVPLPTYRLLILAVSIFLGCFLSIIVLFVREIFKRGISHPEVVEEKLGIPTFAIIPHSKKQKQLTRETLTGSSKILAKNIPKDIAIEGIRSLRTMLEFSLDSEDNHIISILGATSNIGKSFVSTNLAQVFVDTGKKVLLVDCDLRKGIIYRSIGQRKSPGLADLLKSQIELKDIIIHLKDSFDFIPTGEYPANPSELLSSQKLTMLLERLEKMYDLVILDTPPTLAVTDGIILAKYSALNLMVVGCGSDQLEELELMVKRVKRSGITINGLVFNNKSQSKQSYGQYNYYYAYETE
jgi:tyrosine-protein kinase Etk/Wzc